MSAGRTDPVDLVQLLDALDPHAGLAQRHLWLIALLDWVRGDRGSPQAAASRVGLFLDAVQARPDALQRLQAWWQAFTGTVDASTLLADFGFASRTAFLSELGERLRHKLLPGTPETQDASELFKLAMASAFDARWLAALDDATLQRLGTLLSLPSATPGLTLWQRETLEAINYCAGQIRSAGFASDLRQRMSAPSRETQPFHDLATDVEAFRAAFVATPREPLEVDAAAARLRERLDACRAAANSVYAHLEEHGISVGLVFMLRQLRERMLRVRELMDCLLSDTPHASTARLLSRLATVGAERGSLRALIASNSSLLAAKLAERSAETGEHYITRTPAEYRSMLAKAAGGGAATALTTWAKFALGALGLAAFWGGFWAGAMYAASFMLIQLMHWTLATKQPAMTAPAMAEKLGAIRGSGHGEGRAEAAVEGFVDEVAHLVRSQFAGIAGNLALVAPLVLAVQGLAWAALGRPLVSVHDAEHTLHAITLLGPTALFAAFTGVLLFGSSLIAGWAENWFVYHRVDSALAYHPAIVARLGAPRAARWSAWWRGNISGIAANVSLGLMLGLVPAFAAFFGLALEVRHVTLGTGQVAAAAATLGREALSTPALWWCLAALPLTGALNVCVSFYLAFRLALAAQAISGVDRQRLNAAIWARWRTRARDFFVPR